MQDEWDKYRQIKIGIARDSKFSALARDFGCNSHLTQVGLVTSRRIQWAALELAKKTSNRLEIPEEERRSESLAPSSLGSEPICRRLLAVQE
jgi:hypothetical protein